MISKTLSASDLNLVGQVFPYSISLDLTVYINYDKIIQIKTLASI